MEGEHSEIPQSTSPIAVKEPPVKTPPSEETAEQSTDISRRQLLKILGLGTATATAAVVEAKATPLRNLWRLLTGGKAAAEDEVSAHDLEQMKKTAENIGYPEIIPHITPENRPVYLSLTGKDGTDIKILSLHNEVTMDKAAAEAQIRFIETQIGKKGDIDPHRDGKSAKSYTRKSRDPEKPHVFIVMPDNAPLPSWSELAKVGDRPFVATIMRKDAIVSLIRRGVGIPPFTDTADSRLNRGFAVETYMNLVELVPDDEIPPELAQSAMEVEGNFVGSIAAASQQKIPMGRVREFMMSSFRMDADRTSSNAIDPHFYPSMERNMDVVNNAPTTPVFTRVKK